MPFDLRLDHLVYATPSLAESVRFLEKLLGVTPTPGGKHPTFGTENALVGLGPRRYLEIIGPDASAPPPAGPRPFGIDALRLPKLVTWAIAVDDLDAVVARARERGYDPGEPREGSRRTPDGTLLKWRLALHPTPLPGDGLVPFLIEWGDTPHPSWSLAHQCELVDLVAEHPRPANVERAVQALGANLRVARGPDLTLSATIGPRGKNLGSSRIQIH